jgi:hypothetical protein
VHVQSRDPSSNALSEKDATIAFTAILNSILQQNAISYFAKCVQYLDGGLDMLFKVHAIKLILTLTRCLCHAFDQDMDLPDTVEAPIAELNTEFSSWLGRYQKSTHPCDYCRSKSLECFIYNNNTTDGKSSGCSPCNALFRPCSFNTSEKMMVAQKSRTRLDTLDIVAENCERMFGGLTGKKPLRSLGYMGPIEDEGPENKGPKKGAAAARYVSAENVVSENRVTSFA